MPTINKSQGVTSVFDDVARAASGSPWVRGVHEKADPVPVAEDIVGSGVVIDCMAGVRCYDVDMGSGGRCLCRDMSGIGTCLLGPRKLGMYEVGTDVVVKWNPLTGKGIILGAIPGQIVEPKAVLPGYLVPACNADYHNNAVHNYRPAKGPDGGIPSYSSNQPLDATPGSDEGWINELGAGVGLSRFFAWMRGTELSALYCFYMDNLVRLVSYNFEQWTAGGERWIKNDQLENNDVDLFSPYPWEAMGMLEYGTLATQDVPDGGKFKKAQYDIRHPPLEVEQTGIFRHLRFRGYVGDVAREMVVVPEKANGFPDTETISNKSIYTGLLDIQEHIDGHFSVRSAKGISLHKYVYLPVPKQISRPEGEKKDLGDNEKTYKFSSKAGAGAEHLKKDYAWSNTDAALLWYDEVFDFHAYMFNWYGVRGLVEHKQDWYVPEESDTKPGGTTQPAYSFKEDLESAFLFGLPASATVRIDHRATSAKYYFSRAGIDILPDGSILIEDAYGSSIFMTGGSIFRTCAGDDWCLPGRSMIAWAGDDLQLRAGSSVDLTAGKGDLRLKAEVNMHLLSGNSKKGGLLLENRATDDPFVFNGVQGEDVVHSGITLKSEKAKILAYGSEVYVRTLEDGPITLDADKGGGNIYGIAAQHMRWGKDFFADVAGVDPFNTPLPTTSQATLSMFTKDIHTVGGSTALHCASSLVTFGRTKGDVTMMIDGPILGQEMLIEKGAMIGALLMVNGTVIANGSYFASAGGFIKPVMLLPSPVPFPPIFVPPVKALVETTAAAYEFLSQMTLAMTMDFNVKTYATPIAPGNDELWITPIQFSLRDTKQYGLEGMKLFFPRWLKMYDERGKGKAWDEPLVESTVAPEAEMYPSPGFVGWTQAPSVAEHSPILWDWGTTQAVGRGGIYDGAKSAPVSPTLPLRDAWKVSRQI